MSTAVERPVGDVSGIFEGAHRLRWETRIPRPLEEVFAVFAEPENLERITPPWLHFRIVSPRPIVMRPGARIDYHLRLHGLPVPWTSEITVWNPPTRFVDEQVRGPYRLWVHEHAFHADGDGTVVSDFVRYAVPGGALVNRFFVRPDLDRIFRYRVEALRQILSEPLR
jgi:ligand-binding SRPBCC domain-containing protein